MPKKSKALAEMPPAVRSLLRELGANLSVARKRRKESLKAWAGRIGVSEPTLTRMEHGDPSVAFGIYATALWMIGRAQAIPELAAPQLDLGALESEVRVAMARAVRTPISLEARINSSSATAAELTPGSGDEKLPGSS
ncbi:MAG: XRE family transcriptional regulator [Rubrivivax sp.]|nr:XRE family transcriptional regulator [Rubrivivax sp.]